MATPNQTLPEELDEEMKAILDKHIAGADPLSARPWREVFAESREKLKHPAPK